MICMLQIEIQIQGSVHLIHPAPVIRMPLVPRLHLTCVYVILPAATGVSAIKDTPATGLAALLSYRN